MAYLSKLSQYKDLGLLIIRVGLGAMFIFHGYPKLTGGINAWAGLGVSTKYVGIHFAPVFWGFAAALVETLGGFLIVVGLTFRPVCLLLVINLIVAAATHFGKGDGMQGAAHAIEDAIMFAGLFFIGPGKYSVDKK
ncbi:putative oxidoreductase [Mucilaginibacter sp. UYNi724]